MCCSNNHEDTITVSFTGDLVHNILFIEQVPLSLEELPGRLPKTNSHQSVLALCCIWCHHV